MDWENAAEMLRKAGILEPVFAALVAKGYATGNEDGDASKWNVRRHDGSNASMMCKEQRWWDFKDQRGGIGPITAISHVLGLTPPQAASWIIENVDGCPVAFALRESLELVQASKPGEQGASSSPKKSMSL